MRVSSRVFAAAFTALSVVGVAGCGGGGNRSADVPNAASTTPVTATTPAGAPMATADTTRTHHSKLGGAAAGAVAGHMLGGHAVAGAAIGALVQHERNKHGK